MCVCHTLLMIVILIYVYWNGPARNGRHIGMLIKQRLGSVDTLAYRCIDMYMLKYLYIYSKSYAVRM